jgi:phosphoribosylamine--glycine ligase
VTVLIVGSGAREHAIARALARSIEKPRIVCFGSARNPGVAELCESYVVGDLTDTSSVAAFAKGAGVELAIVGPEAPLAAGVADALLAVGVGVVGPTQVLAQIESSKGFARSLLAKFGIAGNPIFERFTSMAGVPEWLIEFTERYVIKDDGLAGGKGVRVWGDHLQTMEESLRFCAELVSMGRPFVLEEKLEGEEFSLLSFCDGMTAKHMPAVQDHKRAYEGDRGPNTGGMGTYTDADGKLPFLLDEDVRAAEQMNEAVMRALGEECGEPYRGVLYGGFMVTANGVKLIEYNARFGDPEALNLLVLLKTDFVEICHGIVDGTLADVDVTFASEASVCKYLVPEGYPDTPRKGDRVCLPRHVTTGVELFLGAVDERSGELVATGSRTLGVVARAQTLEEAEQLCQRMAEQVTGPFFFRKDIGTAEAIARRVEHMRAVRVEA